MGDDESEAEIPPTSVNTQCAAGSSTPAAPYVDHRTLPPKQQDMVSQAKAATWKQLNAQIAQHQGPTPFRNFRTGAIYGGHDGYYNSGEAALRS